MPKKYRLSRAEFLRLPKAGSKRAHGEYFSLTLSPLPNGGPKTACVVSKKIAARAVDRNRIQRRCREVVRSYIGKIGKPLALVFYGKRGAAAASFANTKKDIESLLANVHVLA